MKDYCIILAGGIGSRLWPYSNQALPKQFLDLFGTGMTMLQLTYQRFRNILPQEHIIISTYEPYVAIVRKQLPDVPEECIVAEPVQLSTAPAVALAVATIMAKDPEACIMLSPGDQMILHSDVFRKQVVQGFRFVAEKPCFLVLGVKATVPETNYGYLQAGEEMINGFARLKSFTEKPNLEFARFFVESGEFYWSTGLFMASAPTLCKVLTPLYPRIQYLTGLMSEQTDAATISAYVRDQYPRAPYQSVDLLILEHHENVCIQSCTFGWQDVAGWQDFHRIAPKDESGNAVSGPNITLYDCENNVVVNQQEKTILLHDMKGYLVIEKPNLLLICRNDNPSQLRRMMNEVEVKQETSIS